MNLLDIPQPLPSNPSHELIGTVSENELNAASGIYDETLGRELTTKEAIGIFPGVRVSSDPSELPKETLRHNAQLQPGSAFRVGEAGKLLSSVITQPVLDRELHRHVDEHVQRRDHLPRHAGAHGHAHRRAIEVVHS